MADLGLKQGEVLFGEWWLPSSRERFSGQLSMNDKGDFVLILNGQSFEPAMKALPNVATKRVEGGVALTTNMERLDAVWGTVEGKLLTLVDVYCVLKNYRSFTHEVRGQVRYECSQVIEGIHVRDPKSDPWIKQCELKVEGLHEWLGGGALLEIEELAATEERGRGFRANLKGVEKHEEWSSFRVRGGAEFKIGRSIGLRKLSEPRLSTGVALSESSSLFIRTDFGWNLEEVLALSRDLEVLVSLALCESVASSRVSLGFESGESIAWAELIQKGETTSSGENSNPRDTALIFDEGDVNLNCFLPEWFEFSEANRRHLGLLTENIVGSDYHVETRGLLAGVLSESFYKQVFERDYEPLVETMQMEEAIKGVRKKGMTFLKRALDLYFRLPRSVQKALISNPEVWAKELKDIRHSVAHEAFLDESKYEMALAVSRMTAVIVLFNVLNLCGVDESNLKTSVTRNRFVRKALLRSELLEPGA